MTSNAPESLTKPAGPAPTLVQGSGGLIVKRIGKSFRKRPVVRGICLRRPRSSAASPSRTT